MTENQIIWDVVETHFNEAAFLFDMHQSNTISPDYNLTELRTLIESRLVAHIDGLLIGGEPVAEKLLRPALVSAEESSFATVAALTLLLNQNRDDRRLVFESAGNAPPPVQKGIAEALILSDIPFLDEELLAKLNGATTPEECAYWLRILAERNAEPGPRLPECLASDNPGLRAQALHAVGRKKKKTHQSDVETQLTATDESVRFAAVEAGLSLGSKLAWRTCLSRVHEKSAFQPRYMLLLATLGDAEAYRHLYKLLEEDDTREHALWALSFSGSVQAAELCKPYLRDDDERVAKLAAQVLAGVGGFDVQDEAFALDDDGADGDVEDEEDDEEEDDVWEDEDEDEDEEDEQPNADASDSVAGAVQTEPEDDEDDDWEDEEDEEEDKGNLIVANEGGSEPTHSAELRVEDISGKGVNSGAIPSAEDTVEDSARGAAFEDEDVAEGWEKDEDEDDEEDDEEEWDEGLPAFEADDLDADLVPDLVDDLPRPNVAAIEAWWAENRSTLNPGIRLIDGQKYDAANLVAALKKMPLSRRGPFAEELAIKSGRVVQTNAFSTRQLRQLKELESMSNHEITKGVSPFGWF